jgi:hypothetical protein
LAEEMTEEDLKSQERESDNEKSKDFLDMLHNFRNSYVQLNNQTAVMKHGEAHLTKGAVGKNSLSQKTQFHIWSIKTGAPSQPAIMHVKDFNTTHFGDVQDEYNEILKISNDDTKLLMIGNGRVINYTGDINAPQL